MAVKIQVAVIALALLASVTVAVVIALSLLGRLTEDSREEKDLKLAAELLCPNTPEDVKGDLFFDRDSDDVPYIGVAGTDETVSFYIVASEVDPDERALAPASEVALAYMESMPLSCFATGDTEPPPTDTP